VCGLIGATDVKMDNILANIPSPAASTIQNYIRDRTPTIYGPPVKLKKFPIPLVFARSEYLPFTKLGGVLEDISVCLADYGEGDPQMSELFNMLTVCSNQLFRLITQALGITSVSQINSVHLRSL
jgi:hypothetical protein